MQRNTIVTRNKQKQAALQTSMFKDKTKEVHNLQNVQDASSKRMAGPRRNRAEKENEISSPNQAR